MVMVKGYKSSATVLYSRTVPLVSPFRKVYISEELKN